MGSFVRVALTREQLPKPGHKRCVQGPSKPTTTSGAWVRTNRTARAPISLQWNQKNRRLALAGQGRPLESSAPLTGGLNKIKEAAVLRCGHSFAMLEGEKAQSGRFTTVVDLVTLSI